MDFRDFFGNRKNYGAFHVEEETASQRISRTFRRVTSNEPVYQPPIQYCDVQETKIRNLTGVRQSGGSQERVSMYELQHEREALLLYGIPLDDHMRRRKRTHERPYIPDGPYVPPDPPGETSAKRPPASSSKASSSDSSSSSTSGNGNKVQ